VLLKQGRSNDTFRHTFRRKILNWLITPPARLGLAGKRTHILTVRGRRTGRRYSTPVQLVIDGERRWLVAPYGEREWVKNARAAGEVDLTRALKTTRHPVEEVGPEEAAPVLRAYLGTTPVVQRFFGVDPDDPLDAFVAEAPKHPVFRVLD
jgi:deazaflavin-dependent oxidoreductase (nitroreductase family)